MANGYLSAINRVGTTALDLGSLWQSYFCYRRANLARPRVIRNALVVADLDLDMIREVRNRAVLPHRRQSYELRATSFYVQNKAAFSILKTRTRSLRTTGQASRWFCSLRAVKNQIVMGYPVEFNQRKSLDNFMRLAFPCGNPRKQVAAYA